MSALTVLTLLAVGVGAGIAGSTVGAAGLVTLTALLAMGYAPGVANASTIVALIPGGVSGLYGYRGRLPRDRQLLALLTLAVVGGAMVGSVFLLTVPSAVLGRIVPVVVVAASLALVVQPLMDRRRARRAVVVVAAGADRSATASAPGVDAGAADTPDCGVAAAAEDGDPARPPEVPAEAPPVVSRRLLAAAAASGLYGGWLSVSLGTVIVGLIGAVLPGTDVHRLNAIRLWLSLAIGATAAAVLITGGLASWSLIIPVGLGTLAGGWIGAVAGRRLHPMLLRGLIVASGLASVLAFMTA